MKTAMIFYVAGHSGGHIIPALTHARQTLVHNPAQKIGFFSTDAPLDTAIITRSAVPLLHFPLALGKVRIRQWYKYPLFAYRLIRVTVRTISILRTHRASVVMSMGGFVSLPVCIAAWLLRIPIEVYELNVEPGLAVKVLSRFADTVHLCFADTQKFLTVRGMPTVYPVRFTQA